MSTLVERAVLQRGFACAIEFLKRHQGMSYGEAAGLLGDIVPIALINQARRECVDTHIEEWFLRDSLAREILDICVDGWKVGDTGEFDAADAVGSWVSLVEPLGAFWLAVARSAAGVLFKSPLVPVGWRPVGADDPQVLQLVQDAVTLHGA